MKGEISAEIGAGAEIAGSLKKGEAKKWKHEKYGLKSNTWAWRKRIYSVWQSKMAKAEMRRSLGETACEGHRRQKLFWKLLEKDETKKK
jgi:hypothetical protein